MDLIVRGARLRESSGKRDIGITQGKITAIEGHLGETASNEIDADGGLLTPAFVNIHCHLDKCLTSSWAGVWEETRTGSPEAIPSATRVKESFTEADIVERASRALTSSVIAGTTAVRAFADVDTVGGLLAVKSLLRVKEKFRDITDMQVVAFPQEGLIRDEGTEELLEKSMELGADVVGGMPWYEKDKDTAERHTDIIFRIAKKYDKDIHALIDDNTDPSSKNLEYFLQKSIREGYKGRVAASHCRGALDSPDEAYAKKIVGLAEEAGLTVVENSHISLFMYGRADEHPVRRGVTRVREFLKGGVNVAVAQDDIDDPYYPFGRGDMLELAFMMCHAAHLGAPRELESAFDMVTYNAAKGMRLDRYGVTVGDYADLVLLDACGVRDALRLQPDRLAVIKRGRVVAETRAERVTHF
ncbi:MAG TPA: amidohydrolase family protein [Nitrososphaerales archaeon]|nr:amidohydrolase family protein [Nitrososphaerales archaeon]